MFAMRSGSTAFDSAIIEYRGRVRNANLLRGSGTCRILRASCLNATARDPSPGSVHAWIASQARALNVKAAGYAEVDVWSIVYRGAGFVGAITMVGPDASEAGVKQLALESFTHASQALAQP